MINLKFSLFSTIFTFLFIQSAQGGLYEDIFTLDIYDQSENKKRHFLNNRGEKEKIVKDIEETPEFYDKEAKGILAQLAWNNTEDIKNENNRELIALLYFQKLNVIEKKFVSSFKKRIKKLKELQNQIKNGGFIKSIPQAYKIVKTCVSMAKCVTDPIGKIGDLLNAPSGNVIDSQNASGQLEKDITELELDITRYRLGVFYEPIKELEENYVLKKKRGINSDLQNLIENNLINSRKSRYPFPFLKQSLEKALDFPTKPKILDAKGLLSEFREVNFFKSFNPSIKESLENIIVSIAQFSNQKEPIESHPLRGIYYFWGSAGIGKSESAKQLAHLMKIPYSIQTILNPSVEFSNENLLGSNYLFPNAKPGWLSEALLTPYEDKNTKTKKTYSNVLLILEDFHKILENEQALSFMLHYFDPNRADFPSPYFNGKVNMSRMSIIATGNTDIPQIEKFKAVRQRFTSIIKFSDISQKINYFMPFTLEKKKMILKEYAKNAKSIYNAPDGIPNDGSVDKNNKCEVLKYINNGLLEYIVNVGIDLAEDPVSIRSCQRSIDNFLVSLNARGWDKANDYISSERSKKKSEVQKEEIEEEKPVYKNERKNKRKMLFSRLGKKQPKKKK